MPDMKHGEHSILIEIDALDVADSDKDIDSVPDDEQSQDLVEDPGPDFC
jgi:hypothetical protein